LFITNFGDGSTGGITVVPGDSTTSVYGQAVTPNQPVALNPGDPTLDSLLDNPWGATVSAQGDLFIANFSYLGPGSVVVIPGSSTTSLFGQSVTPNQPVELNPGTSTTFASLVNGPSGIALDSTGNLFVANFSDGLILAIPSSATTSLYGQSVTPNEPIALDPGTAGSLANLVTQPGSLAIDAHGDLYMCDYMAGNQITVIPSPATSTVFGQSVTPNQPTTLDPGTPGTLSGLIASPYGLAFDASGDLFISSSDGISSNQIIVVPSASTTSIFGQSVTPDVPVVLDPGTAGSLGMLLDEPNGLAFDDAGDLFVANYNSNTVTVIASETVPGPPTDVNAVPGDGQVEVSWNAPLDTGGLVITGYTATAFPGGESCTSTTTSCVITGLTNGATYSITVTAINAVGTSDPSDAVSVTIELVPTFAG
jgi:sugar lactone lactonase YvrE